jgi:hypothetical protein
VQLHQDESEEDASNSKGMQQQQGTAATAEGCSNSRGLQQQQGTAATARSQKQQDLQQQEKPAKGGMQATGNSRKIRKRF